MEHEKRPRPSEGNEQMFRRLIVTAFCSVLMLLSFPVCCSASGAESTSDSSSAEVISSADSSKAESSRSDSSWKIYLSIGAGIVIVAVTIGVIASRDA